MSANFLNGVAQVATAGGRDDGDEQMALVRDLLLGDFKQQVDSKLAQLESRVDAMQARIEAMAGEIEGERRTAIEQLSRGVSDLGEQIRRIGKL